MKKLSLVLTALLLAAPVFADEVKQPLTLASADTSASVNLQSSVEASDLGSRLDKEVKATSELLSSQANAKVSAALTKEVLNSVKF